MKDLSLMAIELVFMIGFLGCFISAISFKSRAKKNHVGKEECSKIKDSVKKMNIWKVPSRIFLAILIVSFAIIVVGILMFVIYAIYMLVMFGYSLFVAVMSHAKTDTGDFSDIIFGYWEYCGFGATLGILVSITFFMVKQFFVNKMRLKVLEEKIRFGDVH